MKVTLARWFRWADDARFLAQLILLVCVLAFQGVQHSTAAAPPEASGVPRMKALLKTLSPLEGNMEETVKQGIAVAEAHPTEIETICLLSILQGHAGKIRDAEATLDRARRLDPNSVHVYFALADLCTHKPDPRTGWDMEGAARAYARVVELDPKFGDAWFNLAVIYSMRTPPDLGAARNAYKRAMELGVERDDDFEKLIGWRP